MKNSPCPPRWARLMENENLNEIQISGPGQIFVEGTLQPSPEVPNQIAGLGLQPWFEAHLFTEPDIQELHNFLCDAIEASPSLSTPFVEGTWGGFRVALVDACLTGSPQGFVCLRKQRREPPRLPELDEGSGAFPFKALEMLEGLLKDKVNALIVGPTSSGKTHLLQCLLNSLRADERCLILEDISELDCPNLVSGKLLSRPTGRGLLPAISLQEIVPMAMRLRPDRLILGEMRGPEAKDLLLALSSGHRGSWGSLHAENERQALLRLEMLIQMGAPQWSLDSVRKLIHNSLQTLVVLGFQDSPRGRRRQLLRISQIVGLEAHGFLLETRFESVHGAGN